MNKKRQIGVREVAEACGVSFSTAAAALRGDAWVKAGTREKVLEAAERLGYRRDSAASVLASRRTGAARSYAIAYVSAKYAAQQPGLFERRFPNIEEIAAQRGYTCERIELESPSHLRSTARRLVATGVDGVVVGPIDPSSFVKSSLATEFALVGGTHDLASLGIDVVHANHFQGVQSILHRLAARGYRRAGVILRCHRPIHPDDLVRYGAVAAYRDLDASEPKVEVVSILPQPFHRRDIERRDQREVEIEEFGEWALSNQFDVVVGFYHNERDLLQAAGLPEDMRPDYAAMLVRSPEDDEVSGLLFDQDYVLGALLNRLEENIKTRRRGLQKHPVETSVEPLWAEGETLRRPEAGVDRSTNTRDE